LFQNERLCVRRAYALKALRTLQAYQFSGVYGSCAPVKSQTRACPFRAENTNDVVAPSFGVWTVLLVIGGSILIITNPNANMTPT
jgi:hypothetical protein